MEMVFIVERKPVWAAVRYVCGTGEGDGWSGWGTSNDPIPNGDASGLDCSINGVLVLDSQSPLVKTQWFAMVGIPVDVMDLQPQINGWKNIDMVR